LRPQPVDGPSDIVKGDLAKLRRQAVHPEVGKTQGRVAMRREQGRDVIRIATLRPAKYNDARSVGTGRPEQPPNESRTGDGSDRDPLSREESVDGDRVEQVAVRVFNSDDGPESV
jgi:hypothetical protein